MTVPPQEVELILIKRISPTLMLSTLLLWSSLVPTMRLRNVVLTSISMNTWGIALGWPMM